MRLAIQFGWGMKSLLTEMLPVIPETSIILSPRDCNDKQLMMFGKEFFELGAKNYIDPQLYAPRCDHKTLTTHAYWPQTYSTSVFTVPSAIQAVLNPLYKLNLAVNAKGFILPGLYCEKVEKTWLGIHSTIIEASKSYTLPKLATFCLSGEVLRSTEQINILIEHISSWDIEGCYVIAEHPSKEYLSPDPIWLANLLTLCSSLKMLNKEVILGYANHQMLCMALARVDQMASGSWLNVRSFSLDKFFVIEKTLRKNTWYYCPQALSEYKPEFLDIAMRRGVLAPFASAKTYNSTFADALFSGAIPTTTGYSERLSFQHYIKCLYEQCKLYSQGSFKDQIQTIDKELTSAEKMIDFAHQYGVLGQKRDFEECVDVVRSAIATFDAEKGGLLRRIW